MFEEGETIESVRDKVAEMRPVKPTCFEIFNWPEFKAFAKRLGVDLSRETLALRILFDESDQPVVIEHVYNAEDSSGRTNAPLLSDEERQKIVDSMR